MSPSLVVVLSGIRVSSPKSHVQSPKSKTALDVGHGTLNLPCDQHGCVVRVALVVAHEYAGEQLGAALQETGIVLQVPLRAQAVSRKHNGCAFGPLVRPDARTLEACAER